MNNKAQAHENNGKTITDVKRLNTEEKVMEIARFIAGDTMNSVAIENAKMLIAEQNAYKNSLENIDNQFRYNIYINI